MAKVVNEEVEVSEGVVEVSTAKPVPANVVTLSSGVRVQFLGRLPTTITQQVVVGTFQDANLGADGQIKEGMSSMEQLKLAKKMFHYNKAIVTFALSLKLIKIYDGLPADKEWLDYLQMNPIVAEDNPHVDFNKKIHQEILFLMYVAFANEQDIELISAKLLNS